MFKMLEYSKIAGRVCAVGASFGVVFLLYGIFFLLAGILVAILAYPGPKRPKNSHQ
jgi:hypothetical protein